MFYGHAMFIGGNGQKGSRYLSFPVYRCRVPWRQKLSSMNLNNIIATLSLNSISSVKNSPANVRKRDLNSARWMPQLVSIDNQLCGLDVTISARYDWSVASFHYVIGISGMLPYNRNVTLQTFLSITRDLFHLHSTFARLYNAAASPASRLRSAGSLAITTITFEVSTRLLERNFHRQIQLEKRSAPRIATSGWGSNFRSILRVIVSCSQPIRFIGLDPEHVQSDGKFLNRRLPVLDIPRGRESWLLTLRDENGKRGSLPKKINSLHMRRRTWLSLYGWFPFLLIPLTTPS